MKKQSIVIATLMMSFGASASYAGDVPDVDKSLAQFTNGLIQGNWQPAPSSVNNEKPDVDKSLAQFTNSILGGAKRDSRAVSNDTPDVDKALAVFITSILS